MQYYKPFDEYSQFMDHFRNGKKYIQRSVRGPRVEVPEKAISIVTTCMDRLHDLSRTLPRNIEDNTDYENLEFVLLDYGSRDGLGDWVKNEMAPHLQSGRLSYHRCEARHFCPNHSRNVSFRLVQGELVANVDSDNFTHAGYAKRLNECASVADSRLLIVSDDFMAPGSDRLLLKGRFAMYRRDIEYLRGFDEDLDEGFGVDDVNFVFRAMMAGFQLVRFESSYNADRLPTTVEERITLVKNKDYSRIQGKNSRITFRKLIQGKVSVNPNCWGVIC
jgi:glycosyltransferase involved in cell wall biosynthesis